MLAFSPKYSSMVTVASGVWAIACFMKLPVTLILKRFITMKMAMKSSNTKAGRTEAAVAFDFAFLPKPREKN